MSTILKISGLASAAALMFSLSAVAQIPYNGNGGTGFGGPVGQGLLTLTSDGTTLTGTIAANANGLGTLGNDLVIYIDSQANAGFGTTSSFTDTGGGTDTLRRAISGYDGTNRATLNFAPTFGADYAISLSPNQGQFGALFKLDNTSNFTFVQNANLTPTRGGDPATRPEVAGPYTFSISLANIGLPTSFTFASTYGNFATDISRSNEAFGNTITDVTTPANTGNPGLDTALAGFSTFAVVPEPGTWVMALVGLGMLIGLRRGGLRRV